MSSSSIQLSDYNKERSVAYYAQHIPDELHDLKIWMPCIARQPLMLFSGEHKHNLMTLKEALAKLLDDDWIANRRKHYIENKDRQRFENGIPHLAAIFGDTNYCFVDPDHRWLLDDQGNKRLNKDGKKLGNKDQFDQDQIDAMAVIRDFCPGWKSWSGKGFHGLMKRSDKTTNVVASKVNQLVGGKFLAPFEVKLYTAFLPPYLEPINDIKLIPDALPYVEEICQRAASSSGAKTKSKPVPNEKLPLEELIDSKGNKGRPRRPPPAAH